MCHKTQQTKPSFSFFFFFFFFFLSRKAVRATLVLVPLLGLQYLMMHINPAEGSKWTEAYTYLTAVFVSLQVSTEHTRLSCDSNFSGCPTREINIKS